MKKLVLFCLMLTGVVLSGVNPCLAHDFQSVTSHGDPKTTAAEVGIDDEEAMRKLFEHWKKHVGKATTTAEGIAVSKEYRREGSAWKSGSLYAIIADLEGRSLIHGRYLLIGKNGASVYDVGDDNGKKVVQELIKAAGADIGETACVDYVYNAESRVSCAVRYEDTLTRASRVAIFGFDHAEDDPGITLTTCPDFTPSITAAQVVDDDTLEEFVNEGLRYLTSLFAKNLSPAAILNFRHCLRKEPWKSGNIYFFSMTSETLVFFNGLDATLEDTNLHVVDGDGVNVGDEIIKTVGPEGGEGFVEYRWDDPIEDGDEVRDENGEPIPGKTPGSSLKRSYVKGFKLPIPGSDAVYILGSGIYPEEAPPKAGDDDGGCAVAVVGGAPGNAVFNLLLVVSALFMAAFFIRKPLSEKRM